MGRRSVPQIRRVPLSRLAEIIYHEVPVHLTDQAASINATNIKICFRRLVYMSYIRNVCVTVVILNGRGHVLKYLSPGTRYRDTDVIQRMAGFRINIASLRILRVSDPLCTANSNVYLINFPII